MRALSFFLRMQTKPILESVTYLPEVFYNYGINERGWHWLKCLLDSHYPYPEVSYTAVEFVATGLMGIEPDAPHQKISTLGRLTPDIGWVQLDHIPVGAFDVFVKHEDANRKTTAKNNTPGTSLTWEARFPGSHETLYLDGVPLKARQTTLNGVVISYAEVVLAGGQQRRSPRRATEPVQEPITRRLHGRPG